MPDLRLVAVLPEHSEAVVAVAFSPDGSRVATASRDGR
ncbi:MAG: WD40 repeat domain-containing protein [Polyangiales bacterium]